MGFLRAYFWRLGILWIISLWFRGNLVSGENRHRKSEWDNNAYNPNKSFNNPSRFGFGIFKAEFYGF
jgi:hypothetical protein